MKEIILILSVVIFFGGMLYMMKDIEQHLQKDKH